MNNDTVKLFLDPDLTQLALSNCEHLDTSSLNLIPEICKNLVSLSLNGCGKLSNETLNLISQNCLQLEELTLQCCYRIGDDALIQFVDTHPFLKKLELWWVNRFTARFTRRLVHGCPGLKQLHFILCPQVGDEIIEPLSQLQSLVSLQIEKADGLTNAGVHKMLQGSRQSIARLWINDCDNLTEDCARIIAECPNLVDTSLDSIERMTDAGVELALKKCKLTSLSLNRCRNIGDETVSNIARYSPYISVLHIGGLPRLSQDSLECLLDTFMKITDLDVSWCRWVDDDFLEKFIPKHVHVRRITLWGCSRVTDYGVGLCIKAGWDVVGKNSVILTSN